MSQAVLEPGVEEREEFAADDGLYDKARQRWLDEIEFHQQEKERHDARITELRRLFGVPKQRTRRRKSRVRLSYPIVKGRFDADQGEVPSVGRLIVEFVGQRRRATTNEIEQYLAEKGRPCKPGVALGRLVEDGKLKKIMRGVYELPTT